jgi:hypothetical protein
MPSVLVRAFVASLALLLCGALASIASAAPANDDFAAALVGAGDHLEASGINFGATKEAGEPNHAGDPGGASVWFAWQAPRSQETFVHLCTEGWDGRIGVYRGGAVGGLTAIASGRTGDQPCSLFSFRAISSVTYRFAVDGAAGAPAAQGNFDLDIHATPLELPVNDLFANASVVKPTTYEYVGGSTDGATREPGEPGTGGDLAGASVWFRWTAPEGGPMRLFPCLAGFRPNLGVYVGTSLATLRQVSSPIALEAHLAKDCQLGGLGGVTFDAVAGETYSFAVDGADGGWGRFQLRLAPALVPWVDVYPPGTYIYKLLRLRGRGIAIQFGSGGGGPGDTFLCKLDRRPFAPCRTPRKWRQLEPGMHRVAVVATDAAGNRDPTPAVRTFRIGGERR